MNRATYACTYENCSATFRKRTRYRTHLIKHTGERPFICTFDGCDKTYTRSSHLKRHEETHENLLKCTLPGCSQILKTKATLMKHQDIFHPKNEIKKYKCSECNEVFAKHSMLTRHSYIHSGIKAYKCSEPGCDKSFSMPSLLKKHSKRHKSYYCEESDCFQYFPRWSLLCKHKRESHPKIFRCHICEKVFKHACNLKAHSLTHKLEKDIFRCTVPKCIRVYSNERNLLAHMKTFHETYTLACPEKNCHRFVKTEKELEIHIQYRHRRRHNKKIPKKPEFAEILAGLAKGTKKDINFSTVDLEEKVWKSNDENMERMHPNSVNTTEEHNDNQCLTAQCSQDLNQHLLNGTLEEVVLTDEASDIEIVCLNPPTTAEDKEKQSSIEINHSELGLNLHNSHTVCPYSSVITQNDKHKIDLQGLKQNFKLPSSDLPPEEEFKKSKDEMIEIEVMYHNSLESLESDDDQCSDGENCRTCKADRFWTSLDMPTVT